MKPLHRSRSMWVLGLGAFAAALPDLLEQLAALPPGTLPESWSRWIALASLVVGLFLRVQDKWRDE